MSESYADLARNIIRDSIVSAIYVDDAIVEPYSVPGENQNAQFTLAQNMYASFRKEGKSIDFYKFRKDKNWQDDRHYLFKNRDLLILDWQLDIRDWTLELANSQQSTVNSQLSTIIPVQPELI